MSVFDKERTGTGTSEWSESSCNIGRGCSNGCIYCYARANALRYKQIPGPDDWTTERVLTRNVEKKEGLRKGVIMFPTTHDITETYLDAATTKLYQLLKAGNAVLIVSKPRPQVMATLLERLSCFKQQIMLRYTIGTTNNGVARLFEPGAPSIMERVMSLQHAFRAGFHTSVSAEPLLLGEKDKYGQYEHMCNAAMRLYTLVNRYVTDSIWFGMANKLPSRVVAGYDDTIKFYMSWQNPCAVALMYDTMKGLPKVKFKDSVRAVVTGSSGGK